MQQEHKLFDAIKQELNLKNDAALGRLIKLPAPEVSKIRHGKQALTGDRILQIYDATGWSIEKIRGYL